jgi:hypothetical protein
VLLIAAVVLATRAEAQTPPPNQAAADAAFKQGRELFKANKFAEACAEFEKSQKLDPAYGTLFNIAQCSEKLGKLATAAAAFREVAAKDTNEPRKASAAGRLEDITPRIAHLLVKVDKSPPGLAVEIDDKNGPRAVAANQPIEVDFGDYTVTVRARGYGEFISRVKISQEGKTTTVEATLEAGASTKSVDRGEPAPGAKRKLYAMIAMGTGGAAVVGGIAFGVLARSKWNEAKDVCGGSTCTTQDEVDRANAIGDQARSKALISTVLVVSGLAIGGVGAYLWFTAPKGTVVAPTASDTGAGVTLIGRF